MKNISQKCAASTHVQIYEVSMWQALRTKIIDSEVEEFFVADSGLPAKDYFPQCVKSISDMVDEPFSATFSVLSVPALCIDSVSACPRVIMIISTSRRSVDALIR